MSARMSIPNKDQGSARVSFSSSLTLAQRIGAQQKLVNAYQQNDMQLLAAVTSVTTNPTEASEHQTRDAEETPTQGSAVRRSSGNPLFSSFYQTRDRLMTETISKETDLLYQLEMYISGKAPTFAAFGVFHPRSFYIVNIWEPVRTSLILCEPGF
jgi:hypothetical protein